MKNCPFSGEPCTTSACAAWGTLSENAEDKSCFIIAGCVSAVVLANHKIREERPAVMPFDAEIGGDDDDDERPSKRPRRF